MKNFIKTNTRRYLYEYDKYFYTPTIEEFVPDFMFDYINYQIIDNLIPFPLIEEWKQNCLFKTTPFNSDNNQEVLRKMIVNKSVRAIRDNVKVRVYCKPQEWQPEKEDRIIVLPFWLAKGFNSIAYNKPGDVQILGVDNDYLAIEPILMNESKYRISNGGCRIRNYHVQHYYQWLDRNNLGNVSVKVYKDTLENSNKGFIFEFPVDYDDNEPFETIKIEVFPKKLFEITLRAWHDINEFHINGIPFNKIRIDDPLSNKLWKLGNKILNDELIEDWTNLIDPMGFPLNTPNVIGKYCTGIIVYNEVEITTKKRKYIILTKKIYKY